MNIRIPCDDMNSCTQDSCNCETGCVYTEIEGCRHDSHEH
jgi:hypothetical protein